MYFMALAVVTCSDQFTIKLPLWCRVCNLEKTVAELSSLSYGDYLVANQTPNGTFFSPFTQPEVREQPGFRANNRALEDETFCNTFSYRDTLYIR